MGHSHNHHINTYIHKRLFIAFLLTASFMVVELIAAYLAGSMALASDAGHMFVDTLGLMTALFAAALMSKGSKDAAKSYGWYRVEVFSAGLGVLIMLFLAVFIAYEAVVRLLSADEHHHISAGAMLLVGLLGLAVNAAVVIILHSKRGESLNLQAAYLEVLSDALGSAGVIIAAILTAVTGLSIFDTLIALAIVIFILWRALRLGKQVVRILLQAVPEGIDLEEVKGSLLTIEGVADVHHLHMWSLSSQVHIATANIVVRPQSDAYRVLSQAKAIMQEKYQVPHSTLQIELLEPELECCCDAAAGKDCECSCVCVAA